jgi:hypothetical protein
MTQALEGRGVPDPTASLAAELGTRAFDQWPIRPAGRRAARAW